MRKRALNAAKYAASCAAAFGAVVLVTAILVGIVVTAEEGDESLVY